MGQAGRLYLNGMMGRLFMEYIYYYLTKYTKRKCTTTELRDVSPQQDKKHLQAYIL